MSDNSPLIGGSFGRIVSMIGASGTVSSPGKMFDIVSSAIKASDIASSTGKTTAALFPVFKSSERSDITAGTVKRSAETSAEI